MRQRFDTLQRDEKVQFVCEVAGRVAFEALVLIAVDKGFSKLTALTRLQAVAGQRKPLGSTTLGD